MIRVLQEPFALATKQSRHYHAPQARTVAVQARPTALYVSQVTNALTQTELQLQSAAQALFPAVVPRYAVAARLASIALLVHVSAKCARSATSVGYHLSHRKLVQLGFTAPEARPAAHPVAPALDAPLDRITRRPLGRLVHWAATATLRRVSHPVLREPSVTLQLGPAWMTRAMLVQPATGVASAPRLRHGSCAHQVATAHLERAARYNILAQQVPSTI